MYYYPHHHKDDDDDDDALEPQSFLIELIVLTPSALWLDYLKTNIR